MANPEVQEVQRDKIEFNANNIKEDKDEILWILRNYQKWADYTFDGKKYFSFSRLNWNYIETVFVRDETLKALMEEDEEIEKAFTNIKSFKIETETKTNLTTLEAETNIKKFKSVTDVETYLKEQDEVVLRMIIEKYYNYYKSLKDNLPPSREWNRKTRNSLRKELINGLDILDDFRKDLKRHKNKYWAITIQAYVAQLICYYPRYEEVSHLVAAWWSTSDIPRVILSKRDARRARKQEKRDKKHQEEMNEILVETAVQSQENTTLERQNEWLKHIINWEPIPPVVAQNMNRYTPTTRQEHTTTRQEHTTTRQSNYNTQNIYNSNIVCRPKTFNRKFGERFSNMLEQIFPKWMNKDPRQKEAWTNVWSIIAIWWAVFMWFKAIQSLKKNSEWKRNWWAAAGRTAWTLALMWSDRIIQTIQDAFNLHPAEKARVVTDLYTTYWFDDRIANDITKRYIYAPIETLSALHFIPLYELEANHILEEQDNQIIYNNDNFKQYINDRTDFSDEDKKELLKHGEKIKDDDLIGPWLWALWIWTMSELHDAYDWDKSKKLTDLSQTQKWLDHTIEQIESWVNAELFKQGLRAKPGAIDQIIKEYDAEKDNKKIKDLILDWMRRWLLEISDSSKGYDLQDMLAKDKKDLNLETMTMNLSEFWVRDIKFNTYWELFDAVYLTDFIKYHFAWRPSADGKPPFHMDARNASIEFNRSKWYEIRKWDTKILKHKTLKDHYPTLDRSKDLYIEYLNKWRETTKTEIDITAYPLTNALWIKFYWKEWDEQEVNYLEKYLNDIKTEFWRRHSVYNTGYHTSNWTLPYKFNSLGNKLIFTTVDNETINVEDHVNGNLSKIWLIRYNEENKEKLLNYLNNPSNWMFKD